MVKLLIAAVVFLIIMYLLNHKLTNKWVIYGSTDCGWTNKQMAYMKDAGIPFTFIDCDKVDCGSITAFPTTDGPDGSRTVGFSRIKKSQ